MDGMNKSESGQKPAVLLFNPRSANYNHRIPNSILQVGSAVSSSCNVLYVDGNMEEHPEEKIISYLKHGDVDFFGTTVMPGPQLNQAIPISRKVRSEFPDVHQIWGGYFAANQHKVVLASGYVDFVINGPGDHAFPALIQSLCEGTPYEFIPNLIYRNDEGEIIKTTKEALLDQDALPPLDYEGLNRFYPLERYLAKTYLGDRTLAYHSSMGCPFKCSFCAVVPIYKGRWKGKSAHLIYEDIQFFKEKYNIDAIEFHDNNFFVSEKRVKEFSELILHDRIQWWGEGRIDTIDQYHDDTLRLMRAAGCKMIFFGAESGSDEILKQMDKGGKQSAEQIKAFAARMARFDIIPEYSFVLGLPGKDENSVMRQIESDIAFIKQIKEINPATEIIIYLYSPVPTEGSELYQRIQDAGFAFPTRLEDWLQPAWLNFDLRKNPLTPWLTADMVDRIQGFETVLNGYYPTASDVKLTRFKKRMIRLISTPRYRLNIFRYPYEIKFLQKYWLRYRQPEIEGF